MVGEVERGGQGNIVGELCWLVLEVVGCTRGWRGRREWGIKGREEEAGGKVAEAADVINIEGYQGHIVGVDGVDDSLGG
jgi:hypothetical protein